MALKNTVTAQPLRAPGFLAWHLRRRARRPTGTRATRPRCTGTEIATRYSLKPVRSIDASSCARRRMA